MDGPSTGPPPRCVWLHLACFVLSASQKFQKLLAKPWTHVKLYVVGVTSTGDGCLPSGLMGIILTLLCFQNELQEKSRRIVIRQNSCYGRGGKQSHYSDFQWMSRWISRGRLIFLVRANLIFIETRYKHLEYKKSKASPFYFYTTMLTVCGLCIPTYFRNTGNTTRQSPTRDQHCSREDPKGTSISFTLSTSRAHSAINLR